MLGPKFCAGRAALVEFVKVSGPVTSVPSLPGANGAVPPPSLSKLIHAALLPRNAANASLDITDQLVGSRGLGFLGGAYLPRLACRLCRDTEHHPASSSDCEAAKRAKRWPVRFSERRRIVLCSVSEAFFAAAAPLSRLNACSLLGGEACGPRFVFLLLCYPARFRSRPGLLLKLQFFFWLAVFSCFGSGFFLRCL